MSSSSPAPISDEQNFYQGGLNLTFGEFSVGGVFEYYNDLLSFKGGDDADGWVAGGGVAYTSMTWILGAQYSHQSTEVDRAGGGSDDFTMDRALLTAIYPWAPASISMPRSPTPGSTPIRRAPTAVDDYQALEIGLGTAITF